MARTVSTIQNTIITQVQATPELAAASTTSNRAIWRLWTFVVATAIAYLEQLMDIQKTSIQNIANSAPPGTPAWLQKQVFAFQYDSVTPQLVQLINTVPQYPVVDVNKQIISRCAVSISLTGAVTIKVATGSPPAALIGPQLSALQSYMNTIGVAGIPYNIVSQSPDLLYLNADIYYNGTYSAVILANVRAALNTFLTNLNITNFGGALKLTDIENTIRAVAGVNDVVLKNVGARQNSDPLATNNLINSSAEVSRQWQTIAGYIVEETTALNTWTDKLNFISE